MDSMHDRLPDGRSFRRFNVLDDFNRNARASTSTYRCRRRGSCAHWTTSSSGAVHQCIRCDDGPEYLSATVQLWAKDERIQLDFMQPRQPQQHAYIERYNRTVRYGWLAQTLSKGCRTLRRAGCGCTTRNDRSVNSVILLLQTSSHPPHSSIFGTHANLGCYSGRDEGMLELAALRSRIT